MPHDFGDRPYRALGDRIAALRSKQQLSQRALADRIHVSSSYFATIETGKRRPDARNLRRMADVLGADYYQLAQLAGYLPPPPTEGITVEVDAIEAPVRRQLLALPYRAALAVLELYDLWVRTRDPAIGRLLNLTPDDEAPRP